MRPVRLEVRGFTAFREPTTVEFEGRRLFVITGPTGAGKSSLLDAMMWALYGQVPRVGKGVKELVSQGEREMSVLFEFTVRDQSYRVARRHPATNSTRLERCVQGQWVPMADRATDVTRGVEGLLGMDYQTFTRAIVLPQGQFDSFLRGEAKDRRAILGQLIGLGVYQEAAAIARARASSNKTRAEAIRNQLERLQFASPEHIEGLRTSIMAHEAEEARLAERRKALGALRDQANQGGELRAAHDAAAKAADEAAESLRTAEQALASHRKRAEECAAAVERAEREHAALGYDREEHDRLKAQVALLDQREAAEVSLAEASRAVEEAHAAVGAATATRQAAATALGAAEATAAEGTRGEAAAVKELGSLAGRALRARTQAEQAIADLEAQAARAEEASRTLEQRAREIETLAEAAEAARQDVEAASHHAQRARDEVEQARTSAEASARARDEAAAATDEARSALDHARMQDAASAIRAGLKPGDACPVCGEEVTTVAKHRPADLGKAERALAAAEKVLAKARTEAESATARVASCEARAQETARAHEAATARLSALEKHAEALDATLEAAPTLAARARRDAEAQAAAAASHREEARTHREAADALRDVLARLPETIAPAEAKRGSASAGELRDALDAYRDAARAQAEATRALEEAQRTARDAERDQQAAQRDLERAEKACSEAERRLGALGGVEGDAAKMRRALEEADARSKRVEEVGEALRQARETLASAEASARAAAETVAREQARVQRCATEHTEAETRLKDARAAFDAAWRQTIGAEPAPSARALAAVTEAHEAEEKRVTSALASARAQLAQAESDLEQASRMRTEVAEAQATADLAGAVATELRGDRFIAFLLHESMHLLATDASERLAQFTNGRYELTAEDDEFLVLDRLNGDEKRSVKTLSGGETFLASLALALALSEHLPEISGTGGAVSLDSLFLDEGFGALDAEALDLAVQGLETLAEGSRMVGVISHVEELAERLPDRIRVEKGVHGSTVAG